MLRKYQDFCDVIRKYFLTILLRELKKNLKLAAKVFQGKKIETTKLLISLLPLPPGRDVIKLFSSNLTMFR